MEHAGLLQRGKFDPALPVSLFLHLSIGVLLLAFLPDVEPVHAPPEDSVDVEVVIPPATIATSPPPAVRSLPDRRQDNANAAADAAAQTASRETLPPLPKPVIPEPQLTQANELFSAKTLASPRSRKAREMLATLSGGERNLQLCNLEALEQIDRSRPGLKADLVAPYAMKPEKVSGGSVEVEGGAFRSKRNWFNIRFHCEVDPAGKVVAFAFAIGDALPKDIWQEHNLVADDGKADQ
ncbi:hypothetical protein FHX08_000489 [Rhizobium sp. BK529]|uniref:DUF930 domain-containing protein n=1 Tax=unclassified Rhizobium TaxID=2613769 RepID=UPI00104E4174|nr:MULTISPECIES: DUF930 domain-containing protein [unclassified Rhizobium]MBB3590145.1 hypothetical protein [Rhizobium sp. BK529]TCS04841.1 uncharacterized protein DUF930 [Rhizobium sp. BK418]